MDILAAILLPFDCAQGERGGWLVTDCVSGAIANCTRANCGAGFQPATSGWQAGSPHHNLAAVRRLEARTTILIIECSSPGCLGRSVLALQSGRKWMGL